MDMGGGGGGACKAVISTPPLMHWILLTNQLGAATKASGVETGKEIATGKIQQKKKKRALTMKKEEKFSQ